MKVEEQRIREQKTKDFEIFSPKEILSVKHTQKVYSAEFSPDGKYMVTASADGKAKVIELATKKEIFKIKHKEEVVLAHFSPDSKFIVTGSYDLTAKFTEVASGKEVFTIRHDDFVTFAAFSPDGKYIKTISVQNETKVHEVLTGNEVFDVQFKHWSERSRYRPNDKYSISTVYDRMLVTENATHNVILDIKHYDWQYAAVISFDNKFIATAFDANTTRVIEIETGEVAFEVTYPESATALSFTEDGKYLSISSEDKTARLFKLMKSVAE